MTSDAQLPGILFVLGNMTFSINLWFEKRSLYFFSVPLTGISIALACYVASIALSRAYHTIRVNE
jgi:hypothetical protein